MVANRKPPGSQSHQKVRHNSCPIERIYFFFWNVFFCNFFLSKLTLLDISPHKNKGLKLNRKVYMKVPDFNEQNITELRYSCTSRAVVHQWICFFSNNGKSNNKNDNKKIHCKSEWPQKFIIDKNKQKLNFHY